MRRASGRASDSVACVLGDMDLVRPLALAGVRSAVVAPPGAPPHFSRARWVALEWHDAWTEQEAFVERLLAFARSLPQRPALFYQGTEDLLVVSRHRDALREGFRFIVADARLVEDLTDKAAFHDLAQRLRLPVPRTRRLRPLPGSAPPELDLPYPLLVKPVTRHFARWSAIAPEAKAVAAASADELRALWPRLASAGLEVLVQELIPGPESEIESYHTYVDEDGRVVADFTGKKVRTRPPRFGFSTAVTITDAHDVAELGRDAVRRIGLIGVAKLDFKRTPDGELRLLEVNPRFTLWHHPAALAGVNVPALVWADLNGLPRPRVTRARAGVRWCDLWQDAAAARDAGELGPRWAAWAATCEAKSGFAVDDPMPFVRAIAVPKLRRHARKRAARLLRSARRARPRRERGRAAA